MTELWKDVAGYEGVYQVSDLGRVRNAKGHVLKGQIVNSGYFVVHLQSGGKATRRIHTVHRLVASAFVDNPYQKPEVNHKNGVKTENNAGNLEWSTRLENVRHSYATGLIPPNNRRIAVVGHPVAGGEPVRFDSVVLAEIHFSGKVTCAVHHSMRRLNGTAYGHRWVASQE